MRAATTLALIFGFLAAGAAPLAAEPYVAYVYPAGARAGESCTVTIAGQDLKGASALLVSGGGVSASLVGYVGPGGPLSKLQEEELKERLSALLRKGSAREAPAAAAASPSPGVLPDLPEFRDLEKRSKEELTALFEKYLARENRPKPPMNETATFRLDISPTAPKGARELRLVAGAALSNPLVFEVGGLPEFREPERFSPGTPDFAGGPARPLVPPFARNGQLFPGEVDSFFVRLEAGQNLVFEASARSLLPYLADAVPGWIQPVLELADEAGRELARADDEGRNPDPTLRFTAPRGGVYRLSIRDALYRGRHDFVYRVVATSAPVGAAPADGPAPAGMRAGTAAASVGPVAAPAPGAPSAWSGRLGEASEVGSFVAAPGRVDLRRFEAKAGEIAVAEIRARREGSPLDAVLGLYDASGRLLAMNDDSEDREDALATHHADPYLRYAVEADGTYTLAVADAQGRGGPEYRYDLRLGPPRPDFGVLSDRSAINLPAGGSAVFQVLALRKDGWQGDIEIVLVDPPPGFSLEGGLIPAGRESVRMTLSHSGKPSDAPLPIRLEARARIGESLVVHPVRPCDKRMQAFAYYHYVPAAGFYAGFLGGRGKAGQAAVEPASALRLKAGGSGRIGLSLPAAKAATKTAGGLSAAAGAYSIKAELVDPPPGIRLSDARFEDGRLSLLVSADAAAAGCDDNLILRLSLVPSAASSTPSLKPIDLGLAPAIRISVAAP
ncbi:MAG: hypothetical protein JNG85_12870 [Spirochaetaceae bacterium]|nr:hypothetical protein [Spirochaetaceae bacterium]